jgi:repressor LexA
MDEFDISSTNGVRTTLAALEKKGHIRRHPRLSRGIELVDHVEPAALSREVTAVPLLGRIAAGEPILATGNVEENLQVDNSFLPASGEVFALRVHGESMKDKGILNGDIVLARHQEQAERGDVVVALIDDEATVKTYSPEPDCIKLLPANQAFEPIVVTPQENNVRIAGVVVSLMRRI